MDLHLRRIGAAVAVAAAGIVPGAVRVGAAAVNGPNLSGLAIAGPDQVWAVRDDPSELLLLQRAAAGWVTAAGWERGRAMHYPNGAGSPDAEAVTVAGSDPAAVYVGAERDAEQPQSSRNSILRFETSGTGSLTASQEWRIGSLLPETEANSGIEGLAWIPDDALVDRGVTTVDDQPYEPDGYPGHGDGLFVVGVESSSTLYVVALTADGGSELVATWDSGLDAVMDVSWVPVFAELWVVCDSACDGRIAVLRPGSGTIGPSVVLTAPPGSADRNTEGLAVAPACNSQTAWVLRSDDSAESGEAVWESDVPCPGTAAPAPSSPRTQRSTAFAALGGAAAAVGAVGILRIRRRRSAPPDDSATGRE